MLKDLYQNSICYSQFSWNFNITLGLTEETPFRFCRTRVLGLYSWKIWHFFKCRTIAQICFNQFSWNFNTLMEENSLCILTIPDLLFQSSGTFFMENLTFFQFCFNQFSWNFNTTLGLTEESSLLILSFQSYGNLFMKNLTFFQILCNYSTLH